MPTEMSPTPELVLYTRPGCHLCDEARDLLTALLAERETAGLPTPEIHELNIEADEELHRRYFSLIPVVEVGDRRLELVTSAARLRRLLAEALDAPATSSATR
jgi:hypothetical protein